MCEKPNSFTEKDGWELCSTELNSDESATEDIVPWEFDENFHDAAEKLQISRHVKQTVEYIDLFSPTTVRSSNFPAPTNCSARK